MKSLLSCILFICCGFVFGQQPHLPDDVKASIERRIEYGLNPSIVVGIITPEGSNIFPFGKRSENGPLADAHSIYEIGSISKTFTATLLADQIVRGAMSADDPAQQYLPEGVTLPKEENAYITLGQLSDHTSALPRMPSNFNPTDPANPYADYTPEDLYAFLSTATLQRGIGSEYEYSNLAVGLLGHILEIKTGKSYATLLREVLTDPLGMKETDIVFDENMKNHVAIGHAGKMPVSNWDLAVLTGAGGIRSSAHDMLKYLSAEMHPSKNQLGAAMTLTQQPRHTKAGEAAVGLNWFIIGDGESRIISHGGATGGYRAFAGFYENGSMGVVVLTNSDADIQDIGMHLLDAKMPLQDIRPSATTVINEWIEKSGEKKLVQKFEKWKKTEGQLYNIDENEINSLGYYYLNQKQSPGIAAAIFKINIDAFPASFNVYDSYGEALMTMGKKEEAIEQYKRSIELNPANYNGIEMLAKLGVEMKVEEIQVPVETLEKYVGQYLLAPGYNLTITRDGQRLFVQAPGQQAFELFATSDTEFYLKIVPAQALFITEENNAITLKWMQNGATYFCKKVQ